MIVVFQKYQYHTPFLPGPTWLAALLIGAIVIVAVVAIFVFAAVELAKSTQRYRGHPKGTYFYTEWRKNIGMRNMWHFSKKNVCLSNLKICFSIGN